MGSVGASRTIVTSTGGITTVSSMSVGEAKALTRAQLENTDLGTLQSVGTKFREDGTLAYATFHKEENVNPADLNLKSRSSDAVSQFRNWASAQEPGITYTSIDIEDNNNITAWRPNGDKDFFKVTGGTRTVVNYIEPNNRFGTKDTDTVYVKRTPGDRVKLRFEYVGSKKY